MIHIYYGSQTGTCEYLSFNLKSTLEEKYKLNIICDCLNNFDYSINYDENIVIIITSSYGNGDSPENAAKFWRYIKNRKLTNENFKNMKYIILGLGDSNYADFCGFAKKLDKRLLDLHASKIYDTFYIDSVINEIDNQFDDWISKILCVFNIEKV
jgi:sulfite reductase alpha subunit-like flavoprotein